MKNRVQYSAFVSFCSATAKNFHFGASLFLISSFSHGKEGFSFLTLTGATKSKISLQVLIKKTTTSSTEKSDFWLALIGEKALIRQ